MSTTSATCSASPRRRVRRTVTLLIVAAGLSVGGSARAHSTLVDSVPIGGETVTALDAIVLEFGDAIVDDEFLRIRLETPTGEVLPIGATELVGPLRVQAEVTEQPPPGTYFVRYRVTSIDGDLNEGGFLFDLDPSEEGGGAGTWVLLGVGVAAIAGVFALLRPRG